MPPTGPKPGSTCDVAVVGAGPAGIAAALALAHVGANVVLIGPPPPQASAPSRETRTAALLASSVDLLKALGVWPALSPHAAPLEAIRIVDASRSLLRAPEIEFKASELGLPAFGYNIANTTLVETLYARAREVLPSVIPANVTGIAIDEKQGRADPKRRRTACRPPGGRSRWTALDLPHQRRDRRDRATLRASRHRHLLPPRPAPSQRVDRVPPGSGIGHHRPPHRSLRLEPDLGRPVRRDRRSDAAREDDFGDALERAARRIARRDFGGWSAGRVPGGWAGRRSPGRQAHGAAWRGRPYSAADRRAGAQSRLARRCLAGRLRGRVARPGP